MSLEEIVLKNVQEHPGIKSIRLCMVVMQEWYNSNPNRDPESDFLTTIEHMVRQDSIIEVEYVTPQMDYRAKTIYFPRGTTFTIKQHPVM